MIQKGKLREEYESMTASRTQDWHGLARMSDWNSLSRAGGNGSKAELGYFG
jgi:hypothetical protein